MLREAVLHVGFVTLDVKADLLLPCVSGAGTGCMGSESVARDLLIVTVAGSLDAVPCRLSATRVTPTQHPRTLRRPARRHLLRAKRKGDT